jgi:hypothetical protein
MLKLITPMELAVKVAFPVLCLLEVILLVLWISYREMVAGAPDAKSGAARASKAKSFKIAFWVVFPAWCCVSGMWLLAAAKEKAMNLALKKLTGGK